MKRSWVYLLLAIIILGGGLLIARHYRKPTTMAQTQTFELNIKNKQLVSGTDAPKVKQNDNVVFKITSDEDQSFHLHGYDKEVDLTPGQTTELTLRADVTGHFPFELEQSKTDLGALEVEPR